MGSLCSSGVVGFTRVRAGGRWVHPGSLGSLGFALVSLGSSGVVGFSLVHAGGQWGSLCSRGFALGVVGFILGRWVHSGSRWGPLGLLGSLVSAMGFVGFSRSRLVHSCSLSRSLGSPWGSFIRGRWVHSGCPYGSLGSSGVVAITQFGPRGP